MFGKRWVPFLLSIGLGVLFWVVDALLDFYVYYPGSFLDLLILDPPRHELYVRAVVFAILAIFGYAMTGAIDIIQRSEERYRSIVNSSEIYICRYTPDTKLTFANKAYCERRGLTQEKIIGQSFMSWIPEKDQAFIRRQFQSLTPEDPVITYEHRVITRDGEVTWQRWTDEALFNQQGDLVEYQSIGYDITERVFTQETYQTLVEHSLQGLEIIQEEGIVFANPAMATLSGYSVEELLDFSFEDVAAMVHPQDREDVIQNLSRRIAGEDAPQRQEFRILRKDGQVRWVETLASRIPYHGEPSSQVAVIDITERVRREKALRESTQRLQSVFRAAPVGIGLISDRMILDANQRLCRMTGYSKEELVGKNARILYPSNEDYAFVGEEKYRQIEESGTGSIETRFKRKDGQIITVLLSSTPLNPADLSEGVTFSALDITDRIEAEEQLRSSEQRYRTLFETMSQGVVYQNAEGEIISANPAAEEILGLTIDQMQGRTSMHPDWRVMTMDGSPLPGEKHPSMVALRRGEKVENFVMGVYHPRKEKHVWISVSAVPQFREGSDRPYQVFTTFLDITERVEAERALKEREELLLEAERMARVGGWEIDLETDMVWWSRVTREIHEVPPDYEPTLEEALDFFPPEVHPRLESAIQQAREEGVPYDLELPFITAKRQRLWVHTIGRAEFENGKCVRVHGTFQDITERKSAQFELMTSEEKYRTLFDSAMDALVVVDEDTLEILDANQAAQDMYGYPREELLTLKATDLSAEPTKTIEAVQQFHHDMTANSPTEFRIPLRYHKKRDGSVILVEIKVKHLFLQGKRVQLALIRDITEVKMMEYELRRRKGQLESLTARLVEADEIQRREFARNLHDQVGQSLSLLRFNLDRLKSRIDEEKLDKKSMVVKISEAASLVDETSKSIRQVINNLRPPVLDDYGLFAALHWYADRLQDQAQFRVSVRGKELTPRLPMNIENALFRITQEALANVVSHAQATEVTISLRGEDDQVIMEIADDGRGFRPSDVDAEDGEQGWGLTFMRERVEVIGGSFRLESGVEKGTLVHVQVPRSMR